MFSTLAPLTIGFLRWLAAEPRGGAGVMDTLTDAGREPLGATR
jgi:hypothetical protein